MNKRATSSTAWGETVKSDRVAAGAPSAGPKAGDSTTVASNCEYDVFSKLDTKTKRAVLRKCRPAQQIDLYLRWSERSHPPNYDLTATFASLGKDVLPAVLSRMQRVGGLREDGDRLSLLEALDWMQNLGAYNVAADKALVSRLRDAIALSSRPETKAVCERAFQRLIHPKEPFVPDIVEDDALDIVAIPADEQMPGGAGE